MSVFKDGFSAWKEASGNFILDLEQIQQSLLNKYALNHTCLCYMMHRLD
jgi:hypothetical protein